MFINMLFLSAWNPVLKRLSSGFTTTFKFTITSGAGQGFAFVINGGLVTARGGGDANLGYGGLKNSVAVGMNLQSFILLFGSFKTDFCSLQSSIPSITRLRVSSRLMISLASPVKLLKITSQFIHRTPRPIQLIQALRV